MAHAQGKGQRGKTISKGPVSKARDVPGRSTGFLWRARRASLHGLGGHWTILSREDPALGRKEALGTCAGS